jgi:hypothetical protein
MGFVFLKMILLITFIVEIYSVYHKIFFLELLFKPIVTIMILANFILETK